MDTEGAEQAVTAMAQAGQRPQDVYDRLLELLPDRVLVDKSPLNSKHPAALRRAVDWFGDRARFIHLVRHPHAMIDSYARLELQRLVRDALPESVSPHAAGEISWLESNRNIAEFLTELPDARHRIVRYEELVADPEAVLRQLCSFLELPFEPAVARSVGRGVGAGVRGVGV